MLEKMRIENGYFEYEGKEYILTQQAYLGEYRGEACYEAMAVCADDPEDETGYRAAYRVRWDIRGDYDAEYMGEDMACEWDYPANVEEYGNYSVAEERFY